MSSIKTLNDLYFATFETLDQPVAFRHKVDGRYRDVSTVEFARAGRELALGLIATGLETGDRVAVLAPTRLEWAQADLAILTAGLISVPIYPTVPASAVEYILQDSGAKAIVVADPELADLVPGQGLHVIAMDGAESIPGAVGFPALRERGRTLGEAQPDLHRRRADSVGPGDVATIIYTSGTTGEPKGVMLTHGNITSNVEASLQVLPLSAADVALAVLPLSHIFERMAGHYAMIRAGVTIAYAESFQTVAEDMREVRPTIMACVPRLFEKIYSRVQDTAAAAGPLRRGLFFWSRKIGLEYGVRRLTGKPVDASLRVRQAMADALVFRKIRARTGGRIRFFVSGGAPLNAEIAAFFYAAGIPILEGYGLTETSPVITVNRPDRLRLRSVGSPLEGVEVRIAEDGEILTRGPHVMAGYYNRPEDTQEAMRDGWFHTGDIGRLDDDGFLYITDRKKDLIVTAGGKNIAPQPIENRMIADRYITTFVVLGDGKPFLVALIVPDLEALEGYAAYKKIPFRDRPELVAHPEIRDLIRRRIDLHQRNAAPFETVKRFHLLDTEFEVGELMTPTMKVKRGEVANRYRAEIEALYAEPSAEPAPPLPNA